MSKYLHLKYLLRANKICFLTSLAVQKINFWRVHFGAPVSSISQIMSNYFFQETKQRLKLNYFTQKLYFGVLWLRKEERTRFRKKKQNTSSRLKVGW